MKTNYQQAVGKSILLIVTSFMVSFSVFSQEDCQKCGTREVYCYDVAVQTKNPYSITLTDDCLNDPECMNQMQRWRETWQSYHNVSAGYKTSLRSSGEMPENCVSFYMATPQYEQWVKADLFSATKIDNAPAAEQMNYGDGVDASPTYSSQPPRSDWTDYIIYGTLTESSGNLWLKLTGWNFRRNEEFWTGESIINPDDRENFQGYEQAGKMATGGSPQKFLNAMKSYEKDKRDKSNSEMNGLIAIEPELSSDKENYTVMPGDQVKINIKLMDCDDTPLRNREIQLKVSSGKLSKDKVITDNNGVAIATFTPEPNTSTATLNADWNFEYPSGKKNITSKEVKILVLKPGAWLLRAKITERRTTHRDTVMTFSTEKYTTVQEKSGKFTTEANAEITAIVENLAENPVKDFSYLTELSEPISIIVSGQGKMTDFSNYEQKINGKLVSSDIRNDNVSGSTIPEHTNIQFDYTDDYKYVGISVNIKAVGSYNGKRFYADEWIDYGGDYDYYSINCTLGGDPIKDKNCKVIKSGAGYTATYSVQKNEQKHTVDGTLYISSEGSLNMSLTPIKSSVK